MKKFTIIYTSDLHGNELQYKRLFSGALEEKVNAVVVGGDLFPKEPPVTIEQQRRFIEQFLLPELKLFKKKSNIPVYIMLGNDDWAANLSVLERENETLFYLIHNKSYPLTSKHNIVGYGFVPITPFLMKDWEKWDIKDYEPGQIIRLRGYMSNEKGIYKTAFSDERHDNIEEDLKKLAKYVGANTVFVAHSPPYNTNLDMLLPERRVIDTISEAFLEEEFGVKQKNRHVGSIAIRKFIEEFQPRVSLHGHIHETVLVSKKYECKIGKTVSMSPGNHNKTDYLYAIVLDLFHLKTRRRIMI